MTFKTVRYQIHISGLECRGCKEPNTRTFLSIVPHHLIRHYVTPTGKLVEFHREEANQFQQQLTTQLLSHDFFTAENLKLDYVKHE
jgi:hypothetical protein